MSRDPNKPRRVDFYFDDWLAGTSGLSLEERGALITVCSLIWSAGGPLRDDEHILARQLGVSVRKWKQVRETLISQGKLSSDAQAMLHNARAENELNSARKRLEDFRQAGKVGGRKSVDNRAKILTDNDMATSNASSDAQATLQASLKHARATPPPPPSESSPPPPSSGSPSAREAEEGGGSGTAHSDQARAVTAAFLAARSRLWPSESALPAPTLTILAQAEGYVARAGSAQLVVELVNRQIERAAAIGKRAPSSLAAFNRSLDDGITSHLTATKPVDKPKPQADDADPPAWERPTRTEQPANGAASDSDLVNGKPYPTDDFIRASDPGAAPFWIAVRDWRTHRKWRNASGNDVIDREPIPEEWLPPAESARVHSGPGYGQIEAWWVSRDWARH